MTSSKTAAPAAGHARAAGRGFTRLVPPIGGSALWGWAGPLLVTALGAFLRFSRLGIPRAVVFDETYYVPDAYGILRHGVEINHAHNVNALLVRGSTSIFRSGGEFVVHPPLGKVAIAGGEWLFGLTPFGWRFAVAVTGSLSVLLLARIARRMTRSTMLGCVAGLLLALDGLEFVLSRTAILDIFVMFWVLAAFGLLVVDRDRTRAVLAADAAARTSDDGGPKLGIRWARVLAGLCLGCACASKWNGIWYVPAFAVLALAWDFGARRAAGFASPGYGVLRSEVKWFPVWFGLLPLASYLASWSGWFATGDGYDRNWAAQHGNHVPVWSALDSLYQYNREMLQFGLGLTATQTYKSQPWTWLAVSRPVSFFYATPRTCGAPSCSQEVLAIGTPLIWWASIPALLSCLAWWLTRRDWRAGAVLMGVAAGWLPWFWFAWHDHRTMFYFYAVVFEPFLIIAITLGLGLILGPATAGPGRRTGGAVAAGVYLLAVLADFAYLYPVLAAQVIPYGSWVSRMWLHSWI
ncbi:MAG: dolichyl-phosphate-mannose--protein mannosyltransferase [Streptosporangiaceae bacterium]